MTFARQFQELDPLPFRTDRKAPMSRIVVDTSRCEGHGLCEGIAPDVFALHDEGAVEVLIKEPVAGGAVEAAGRAAALACPVAAIRVTS